MKGEYEMARPINCPKCGNIVFVYGVEGGSLLDVKETTQYIRRDSKQYYELKCHNCSSQFVSEFSHTLDGLLFEVTSESDFTKDDIFRTSLEFDIDERARFEYEVVVRYGPPVQTYVMTREEYAHFVNEERFKDIQELASDSLVNGTVSGILPPGEYTFDISSTEPTSESKIEYCVRAEYY